MLTLNGLKIAVAQGDQPPEAAGDLLWRVHRVESLPDEPLAGEPILIVRPHLTALGTATEHVFGYDGRVRCRWRVEADGSAVTCWAVPEVSERDLFSLFSEAIMRTVLSRREMASFHAAALAKEGRAILIMADKGAGKSTLSWALQRTGWQLLADDLARVGEENDRWIVFPGHRQTKLTPEAARVLGYSDDEMETRFDDAGPPSHATLYAKRVVEPWPEAAGAVVPAPLGAVLFLNLRDAVARVARAEAVAPTKAVRLLLEHSTPDPMTPSAAPPAPLQRALGRIALAVPMRALTLPNDLDCLSRAAEWVDRLLAEIAPCR